LPKLFKLQIQDWILLPIFIVEVPPLGAEFFSIFPLDIGLEFRRDFRYRRVSLAVGI
jgi:hypothetical protein